jgi:hypothetical protein
MHHATDPAYEPAVWCRTMARGVMRLPLETFGVLRIFSGYFRALGDFGFDAAAFAVVFGAGVDFGVDEAEEFGEVGSGPASNRPSECFRNHWKRFTV